MDDQGYFRMSLSVIAEQEAAEMAKMIILEVNPNLPQTNGDVEIHISDVDYLYESNEPIVAFEEGAPGEVDMKIGKYVADLVPTEPLSNWVSATSPTLPLCTSWRKTTLESTPR